MKGTFETSTVPKVPFMALAGLVVTHKVDKRLIPTNTLGC
ncbi:hypothetical protein BC739_008848 [Kutzneria viridogrisea]|uniref:Uncharacterized protein n=1 Tax=Kutzneria viridogrisea TaxID=47990 RepID=A0ABR6BYB2_9PSEU|nr:hypothetical protein [Kutzneria viridogrisea]